MNGTRGAPRDLDYRSAGTGTFLRSSWYPSSGRRPPSATDLSKVRHERAFACTTRTRARAAANRWRGRSADSERNARVCRTICLHLHRCTCATRVSRARLSCMRVWVLHGCSMCALCVRWSWILPRRRPPSQRIEALISLTTLSSGLLGAVRNFTRRWRWCVRACVRSRVALALERADN